MNDGRAMSREIALENLVTARDVLAAKGVPLFFVFGTLLGAMREHDFIAHDDDMDVCVYERDKAVFFDSMPELEAQGWKYLKQSDETRRFSFARKGIQMDVFFALEVKKFGFIRKWDLDTRIQLPARRLDTLESIDFLGERFNVPADPYKVIRHLYGKTWNIPITNRPPRQGLKRKLRNLRDHPEKTFFYIERFLKKRIEWSAKIKAARRDQKVLEKGQR
jgi:lipopolysaccharide cholinephosphotransferase